MNPHRPPIFMIVSGPAGSGKTTVCDRLRAEFPQIHRVVTATTRAPRGEEVDGVDYYFLSREEFDRGIEEQAFFEYATIHGNSYGTLKQKVYEAFNDGYDLLLNIDVQGAENFQKISQIEEILKGRIASVFIMPPSLETIRQRMEARGQDHPEVIERRLETAKSEMEMYPLYDYVIVSADKENDYDKVRSIYIAEKQRNRS